MSVFEKQAQLGRDLFEINASTVRRLVELQAEGVKQYFETNQTFATKLSEVRDVTSFFELQREYGETLWGSSQEGVRAGGEIVREAVESAGEIVRTSFGTQEVAEEAAAA